MGLDPAVAGTGGGHEGGCGGGGGGDTPGASRPTSGHVLVDIIYY